MSTVEPFGTWQYAQAVCLPLGRARRVEEALLGEEHVRPLGDRRLATAPRSDAAISSSVPPRWTVAARAHSAARQGIGPSSAQSSLNTPGP